MIRAGIARILRSLAAGFDSVGDAACAFVADDCETGPRTEPPMVTGEGYRRHGRNTRPAHPAPPAPPPPAPASDNQGRGTAEDLRDKRSRQDFARLRAAGFNVQRLNAGRHLQFISDRHEVIDYFPATGKYYVHALRKRGRGLSDAIKFARRGR